ncbi:unnamed protein product [Haemonchus placei]|uniref:RpiR family transcriptional regulator n=1 Tax=Haemonchus placei TaxID=6290 RepID=A0A0N4WC51_HAEPC|nr:unnamed protein product [Haemonchus placei]
MSSIADLTESALQIAISATQGESLHLRLIASIRAITPHDIIVSVSHMGSPTQYI